jgi:DNA-binding GntR family transcriptional regulator
MLLAIANGILSGSHERIPVATAAELAPVRRAQSLADQAYQSIREAIATGVFQAGERMTERGLAARLGVSPTPVREALRRLEQDGLVDRVSPRELRVVEHSPGTLRELLVTSAVLRALEARFAASKITDAALDRMQSVIDSLSARHDRLGADELRRLARAFDREIEQAAGNPTLRALIESLSIVGQDRLTRAVQARRENVRLGEERLQSHRDILAALRRRDPDAAERAFRHNAVTSVDLLLGDLERPR